jgi:hypothetical protein
MTGATPDTRAPFSMPPHRRLAAWLVTDRVGQGMAITLMIGWALFVYTRMRLLARARPAEA